MALGLVPIMDATRQTGTPVADRPVSGAPVAGAPVAGTPVGIAAGWGTALLIAVACGAAVLPAADHGWRFAIIAGAVAVFAALSGDVRAVPLVAGIAWLVYNGFLLNALGVLSWHGLDDLWRVLLVMAAGAAGLAAGAGYRRRVARRGERADAEPVRVAEITALLGPR